MLSMKMRIPLPGILKMAYGEKKSVCGFECVNNRVIYAFWDGGGANCHFQSHQLA